MQLFALAYYTFSYFPGGIAGLKLVSIGVGRALRPLAAACGRCLAGASSEAGSLLTLPPGRPAAGV